MRNQDKKIYRLNPACTPEAYFLMREVIDHIRDQKEHTKCESRKHDLAMLLPSPLPNKKISYGQKPRHGTIDKGI
jgi:hypothetical protein